MGRLATVVAAVLLSGSAHAGTVQAFAGACGIRDQTSTGTGGTVTAGQREVPGGWFAFGTCDTFARASQGSVGTAIRATAANGGFDGRGAGGSVRAEWRTQVTIRPINPAASPLPPGSSVPVGLRADLSYDYRAARSVLAGAPVGVTGGDFGIGFSALFGYLGIGWVLRDEVTLSLDRGLVRGPSNSELFGPEGFGVVSIPYFGRNISGPTWNVPIGQSFEFGMVLSMTGGATAFLGEVVGEADASNSLKLPLGDVLLLPAGFTADSDDGTIVDNRWVFAPVVAPPAGVPEPGTLGLLALGLLGGFVAARRGRAR